MKKIIRVSMAFFLVLLLMALGCDSGGDGSGPDLESDNDNTQEQEFDYSGADLSLSKDGKFKFENILTYYENTAPEKAEDVVYFFSDDTGWCGQGKEYDLEDGTLEIDLSRIDKLESGVIRFKIKYLNSNDEYQFLDPESLSDKDKKMFVRETSPASTYMAGDMVFAVLLNNGWFSPVPTNQEPYGRDNLNWTVESRNHERSDCLIDGNEGTEEESNCVSASIDKEAQVLYLDNVYAGFETPDDAIGEIMAVSDKTGWSYMDGVPVIVTDGRGKVDLSKLMFAEGPTRFNLIMDINGEDYWFVSSALCLEAQDLLLRKTESTGDTVMALEDVTSPVSGDTVRMRDQNGDYAESACVSVSVDKEKQLLYLKNIYKGFETPDQMIGEIMAVSDKTGWSYMDGVPVIVTDGRGKLDLSKLMFAEGATRFNLIMDINGEDYWFVSSALCPESQDLLLRKTESTGDTVMALEDVVNEVEGDTVQER